MIDSAEVSCKLSEKCAVVGIIGKDAPVLTAESLFALQHRGAEATGLACLLDNGPLESRRGNGLVRDVYKGQDLAKLKSKIAIGHNRYSTNGSKSDHLQPIIVESLGFAFAHNGNLPNTEKLEKFLAKHNVRTKQLNDSEMMGLAISQFIRDGHSLHESIKLSYPMFTGAFSCVVMYEGKIAAFRDSKGIRPLALGKTKDGLVIASETCGLDIVDAQFIREIAPGELVIVSPNGIEVTEQLAPSDPKLDIFEFVYFARHDSTLYGEKVNEVRRRFGEQLADQHPPQVKDRSNIIVVPVPDTSVPASEGFSEALGVVHRQAIIKNRYVGRSFMQPNQLKRTEQLRLKHTIIPEAFVNRDVVLIDDSIVRLNTMPRLVKQVKDAGAKSVTVLIASPPVRFPDFYGIDTPSQNELAAANMSIDEIQQKIGCDYLGYLSIDRMIKATRMSADMFNLSCFNGEYPISIGHNADDIRKPHSMDYAVFDMSEPPASVSSKQKDSGRISKVLADVTG